MNKQKVRRVPFWKCVRLNVVVSDAVVDVQVDVGEGVITSIGCVSTRSEKADAAL